MRFTLRSALVPLVLCAMVAPLGGGGCDEVADLAEQCGLVCPDEGVLEGNASISGIASVDAFFSAVVDAKGAADGVSASVRTELDAIAQGVGLAAGASPADIRAALEAKIAASVTGGLTVAYEPRRCEASVEVTANAAASCQANVDPGSIEVTCEGTCTIDASAQAQCAASGGLTCRGQAPNLACDGSCTGSCALDVAATCSGTCRGVCSGGTCSVVDVNGNCNGACSGTCQGTCELSGGGTCAGRCEGTCEYTPPSGVCDAGAEARCSATAEANVKCKGGCDGKATPPSVSAECQAKASANVECRPPSVEITWQFKAGLDAQAQAEFRAWVGTFKVRLAGLLAAAAKVDVVLDASQNLVAAASGAVKGAVDQASASEDLKLSIGAGCALLELPDVGATLNGSIQSLGASADAVVQIKAGIGL